MTLWDAATGEKTNEWNADGWVHSVAYSPDGERVVACTRHGAIRLWDTQSGDEAITLRGHEGAVNSLTFSSDGSFIVSGGQDGKIRIWDAGPFVARPGYAAEFHRARQAEPDK